MTAGIGHQRTGHQRTGQDRTAGQSLVALIAALIVVGVAAAIGSLATFPALDPWYAGLAKPPFNPPNAVFGPVWTVLYVLMAIAAWRVWLRADQPFRALAVFAIQLVLNVVWSLVFFGLRSPAGAFVVIVLLALAILATVRRFERVDHVAAGLLLPYLAWVCFAAVLNGAIVFLNPA